MMMGDAAADLAKIAEDVRRKLTGGVVDQIVDTHTPVGFAALDIVDRATQLPKLSTIALFVVVLGGIGGIAYWKHRRDARRGKGKAGK